jgi:Uma2 family endonuclease
MMMITQAVQIPSSLKVTDEQFRELVQANPELRLERSHTGELIIMSPTGSEGGNFNAEVTTDLGIWNRQTRLGKVFDSSTGFKLPNGATRAPDTAWIAQARWDAIPLERRKGFAPICPDFVIELASENDDIAVLRSKMQEYMDNGCLLGWLIDPRIRQVEIYRSNRPVEVLAFPTTVSGEDVLPGFVLNLE